MHTKTIGNICSAQPMKGDAVVENEEIEKSVQPMKGDAVVENEEIEKSVQPMKADDVILEKEEIKKENQYFEVKATHIGSGLFAKCQLEENKFYGLNDVNNDNLCIYINDGNPRFLDATLKPEEYKNQQKEVNNCKHEGNNSTCLQMLKKIEANQELFRHYGDPFRTVHVYFSALQGLLNVTDNEWEDALKTYDFWKNEMENIYARKVEKVNGWNRVVAELIDNPEYRVDFQSNAKQIFKNHLKKVQDFIKERKEKMNTTACKSEINNII